LASACSAPSFRVVDPKQAKVLIMLTGSRFAVAAMITAGIAFGVLADAAHAAPKKKPVRHPQTFHSAPVYLHSEPGIISGYRNTPENWVPPPMTGGGVG
jgi:hypothetical protein